MKKIALSISLFSSLLFALITNGQTEHRVEQVSPRGVFDKVYDRFGNRFELANLKLAAGRPIGGGFTVTGAPTATCNAGYFNLFFAPNSIFITTPQAQTVLCQVFSDISNFIISTLSVSVGVGPKINIYCDNTAGNIATASQFYVFPGNPTNPNPGIIRGQIEKMILSGADPYASVPITFSISSTTSANNFYHGFVGLSSNFLINYSLGTQTNTNTYDAYSVFLHEVCHALGFASLISTNGVSNFGSANNYYSAYDTFLTDASGTSLLTSITATSGCPASNLAFTAPLTAIKPGLCTSTSTPVDLTTCSLAALYAGGSYTVKVYTPNCFEATSSLSHFEDMCSWSGTTACTQPTNAIGYNNLIFAVSNATGLGPCFMKRYLQPEERAVLCDLGYTVSNIYLSSNAVIWNGINGFAYGGGQCNPTNIYGNNDGLVNGVYTFTATGSSISIPTNSILGNDLPASGLSVSCVEVVYYNTVNNFSAVVSGSNLVVTGTPGSGLALIKYLPKNSSNKFGNATYVYVYFMSANCSPATACNLVQNPGFEFSNSSVACGVMTLQPGPLLSCWDVEEGNPSVLTRSCTTGTVFNLGFNTIGSAPNVINSFNGPGNNRVVALNYTYNNSSSLTTQAIKNNLGTSLNAGTSYQLSFFAYNCPSSLTINSGNNSPVVITVATNSVFGYSPTGTFPTGLNVVAEFTLASVPSWSLLSSVFTFTSALNASHQAFVIGINAAKTLSINPTATTTPVWCYLDEISLVPLPNSSFLIPFPLLCGNSSITNLSQYVFTAGTFSGNGVSLNNGTYNFNFPVAPLNPGFYPIAYTYSANGCQNTSYQMVTINTNTNYLFLPNTDLCTTPSTLNLSAWISNTTLSNTTTFSSGGASVTPLQTFNSVGNYTFNANNATTGLCNFSYSFGVNVFNLPSVPAFTTDLYAGINTATLCLNRSMTLTAVSNASFVIWQPGNLTGPTQTLQPSVPTVYTVSAFNGYNCAVSNTFLVNVINDCCGDATLSAFSQTAVASNFAIFGPAVIQNDVTVFSSLQLTGDIAFKNGAKIIVENGGMLTLAGAHLHACDAEMWKGIVLKDGGNLNSGIYTGTGNGSLLEDAITGIDVSNHFSSGSWPILDLNQTVFNKNYIDINVLNYQRSSNTFSTDFNIRNCVFSCANYTYNYNTWPMANTSDLRLVGSSTPTTGLSSPFQLQSAAPATLLAPYAGQTSSVAINFNTVGITANNQYYGIKIGSSNPAEFNLFDNHHTFIRGINSNLTSINNVFQNTTFTASSLGSGSAIYLKTTISTANHFLDLNSAGNTSTANRFWNCHRGVEGKNIYRFEISNALFRSTQSNTTTSFSRGNTGIVLNTNRFRYWVLNSEFTNINTGINIPLTPDFSPLVNTCSVCVQYGIFAGNLTIQNNHFGAGTGTNNYVSQAIDLSNFYMGNWTILSDPNISPSIVGTFIQNNSLINVYRGIRVNGIKSFPTLISDNTIQLNEDPAAMTQHGIELANCSSNASNNAKHIITRNTLKSVGNNTLTNSTASLVLCSINAGINSPSVTCNKLSNSFNGFVFEGPNQGTQWMGNEMTALARGMLLTNSAVIGQQGGPNLGMGNSWLGTWTPSLNFGTFCSQSTATSSPLYRASSTGVSSPPNNSGLFNFDSYGNASNNSIRTTTNGASFDCYAPIAKTNNDPIVPVLNDGDDANAFYIAQTALYRFLNDNDSILNGAASYLAFFNDLAGSSIDIFVQVNAALSENDFATAAYLKSTVSSTNSVENNYLSYYDLYMAYAAVNFFNDPDINSSDLLNITQLCPCKDGAVSYQARALYNSVFNISEAYPNCSGSGARIADKYLEKGKSLKWTLALYPNPAASSLSIISNVACDYLYIQINDLSGRLLLTKYLKPNGLVSRLDLDLINGAYIIKVTNNNNETDTKKLLISR